MDSEECASALGSTSLNAGKLKQCLKQNFFSLYSIQWILLVLQTWEEFSKTAVYSYPEDQSCIC